MDVVLDLDLDLFVDPTVYWPRGGRLADADHETDSHAEVAQFLEGQCKLSSRSPVLGYQVVDHDEAFFVWKRWLAQGLLRSPFVVLHADAHADLGMGAGGFEYLTTEHLALPIAQRAEPRRGSDGL